MIKRFVILQDEQMVLGELSRPRQMPRVSAAPAAAAAAAAGSDATAYAPPPAVDDSDDDDETADEAPPAGPEGRRLADVSREASLTAERAVIGDTLRQVMWNRRKAAQLLGVSYKTLLNKIKETGLEKN
jgi:DNA-binding NtrC family response regulator